MKKTIVLSLGLLLLGASALPFANASRQRYHQYLYEQQKNNNPKVAGLRRRGTKNIRTKATSETKKNTVRVGQKNLRYNAYNKRNTYSKQRQYHGNYRVRPMSDRITGSGYNPPQVERKPVVVVKPLENEAIVFETFINDAFSIWMPKGWFVASEDPYHFVNPQSSFQVEIKKFKDTMCDTSYNFEACALKLSQSENNLAIEGPGELSVLSQVKIQSQWADTVLNDATQTKTLVESFVGRGMNNQPWYYNRYYVGGTDGSIYLVQTKVKLEDSPYYIKASKRIFDSFRAFKQES